MASRAVIVIQTGAPRDLIAKLKIHALERRILLCDLQSEIVEHFLAHREALQRRGETMPYLSGPHQAARFNLALPPLLAKQAEMAAATDRISVRQFMYVALVSYAAKEKLIPPFGSLDSMSPSGSPPRHQGDSGEQRYRHGELPI